MVLIFCGQVLSFIAIHLIFAYPSLPCNSSNPDVSFKPRVSEASDLQTQQHNGTPFLPLSRTPFPAVTIDQSITTYSGKTELSDWTDALAKDQSYIIYILQETQ